MAGEPELDDRNAAFWDEVSGTNLARTLGIAGRLLEIGLGYGRLGEAPARRGLPRAGPRGGPG